MRVFFQSWVEIEELLGQLHLVVCARCGGQGTMGPHGWRHGYDSRGRRRLRGRRVRCLPRRGGCGRTPCLRPGNILPRRWFDADELERFIRELRRSRSVKAAWERSGIRMSLDSGYRLYRRLRLCVSTLRTRLSSRAPPPGQRSAGSALTQVFEHLYSALGDESAATSNTLQILCEAFGIEVNGRETRREKLLIEAGRKNLLPVRLWRNRNGFIL